MTERLDSQSPADKTSDEAWFLRMVRDTLAPPFTEKSIRECVRNALDMVGDRLIGLGTRSAGTRTDDAVRAALIDLVRLKDLKQWIESDVPKKFTGHSAEHWQRVQQYEREKEPAWEAARLALEETPRSASERIGDADRYRWLCNKFEMLLQLRDDETIGGELPPLQHVRLRCGIALDEWIDARIKEENATGRTTDSRGVK